VAVTATWVALIVAGASWEVACQRSGGRWASLADLVDRLWIHLPGRIILVLIWAFIGWHVFARYTLPA
jgi:hypothetical protein